MDNDSIIGWRGWKYDPVRQELISLVWNSRWPKFHRFEAERPGKEGITGVHAWLRRDQLDGLIQLSPKTIPVWGQVSMWGKVIQHDGGLRAQYAYPYSFLILRGDRRHASALSGAYGVEVTTI